MKRKARAASRSDSPCTSAGAGHDQRRQRFVAVAAGWDGAPPPAAQGRVFDDPRGAGLGWRAIAPHAELEKLGAPASEQDWHAHRIACSAPQGGVDFPWGDTFPHEANMDRLNGIDFKKGATSARKSFRGFSTEGWRASELRAWTSPGKRPRQAQRSPLARSRSARWDRHQARPVWL